MGRSQVKVLSYSMSDWMLLLSGAASLAVLCFWSANNPFFWDNILNARIASFYLGQSFSTLVPPTELDAGHPPGFNLYLAGAWSLYGRHLPVAHLVMLPFLIGIVFHFWRLSVRFIPEHARWVAMAIFIMDPTLLAQATQVSPDLALLCFLLAAVDALVSERRALLLFALIGMSMVSFRGILAMPGIFLLDILLAPRPLLSLRRIWPYAPAAILVLGWWFLHHQATGWAVSPPEETYGAHREAVGLMGMLRNAAVMIWRILDQGRVLVVLAIGAMLAAKVRRNADTAFPMRPLLLFLLVPAVTWAVFFIPLSNPIGHRYWMVTFAGLALMAAWLLSLVKRPLMRTGITVALCAGLLSGHYWLYPDPIAKGWDSTLAHTHWFKVQRDMDAYLNQQNIVADICTDFPNLVNHAEANLHSPAEYPQKYSSYSEGKSDGCMYVVQGNVMNGFEREDLNTLATDYSMEKEFRSGPVYLRLYRLRQ